MSDLAKFLYTHNPFYLISAGCVLFGVRTVFQDSSDQSSVWMLAISLAAYTLLLTATAVVIVRWGKVWDDARTVALLAILMCLALSSSFDSTLHRQPIIAGAVLCGGLAFSILVVRFLEVGLAIALPPVYRRPLLGMLSLFFLFPLFIMGSAGQLLGGSMAWRVLMFPVLCGALILTLIPAAKKGAAAVANNGSPWPWPLYPWSIFFFILVGMIGRSYLLTISFQLDQGTTSSFSAFYLVPILLATIWVLTEGALASKNLTGLGWLSFFSLGLPLISSLVGKSYAAFAFQLEIMRTIASPLWLTVIASLIYSLYFWWKGSSSHKSTTTVLLLVLVGISPTTQVMFDYKFQNAWPLFAVLVFQLVKLFQSANLARYSFALLTFVATVLLQFPAASRFGFGALPIHLILIGLLLGALWFDDWLARRIRAWLAPAAMLLVVAAMIAGAVRTEVQAAGWIYASFVLCGLIAVSSLTKLRTWWLASLASLCVAFLILAAQLTMRLEMFRATQASLALLAGASCFVCGTIISAAKAGLGKGASSRLNDLIQRVKVELLGEPAENHEVVNS